MGDPEPFFHDDGGSAAADPDGSATKTSFYVWYLGSEPSAGLRGSEFLLPKAKKLIAAAARSSSTAVASIDGF